jgi:hypothetical protein
MWLGTARGDDANHLDPIVLGPCVRDNHDTEPIDISSRLPPLLTIDMPILHWKVKGVCEYAYGRLKTDAVLAPVGRRFVVIPGELHTFPQDIH